MQRLLLSFVSIVVLAFATCAAADPQKLTGDYAVTGTAGCVISIPPGPPGTPGFNPNLTSVPGSNLLMQSSSTEGIFTFNGNGTGTGTTTNVTVTLPQTLGASASASSAKSTAPFTYTVDNDGTVTIQFGLLTGTVLSGTNIGQTFTTSGLPPSVGLISKSGDEIPMATVDPAVERQTSQAGNTSDRVCHRSRVLVRLNKSK